MGSEASQTCGDGASGLSVEALGCSCSAVLQIISEVSPSWWPFMLGDPPGGSLPNLPLPRLSPCPQPKPENAITIAVSSRALFRMEEEQRIYTEQGVEAYVKYQLDHENEPFLPGAAFPFVKVSSHSSPEILEKGQSSRGVRMDTNHGANRGQINLPASDVLLPGLHFPS